LGNVIGFESINPSNLPEIRKTSNETGGLELYAHQIKILPQESLQTWGALEPHTKMRWRYRFVIYAVTSRLFRKESFEKPSMRLRLE